MKYIMSGSAGLIGNKLKEKLGEPIDRIFTEPEIAQPQQVKIDISKLRKFGYNPKIKIEEGLDRLIEFYKRDGQKWLN